MLIWKRSRKGYLRITGRGEAEHCSRLRGPPGPPTGQARVLGFAKQRHGLLGCNVLEASPAIHPDVTSNAAEPDVRGGRCTPR